MRKILPIFVFAMLAAFGASSSYAISTTVVVNEVYGGAGCMTAGCSTYDRDFIELKNISLVNQSIGGWSVQYAADTGTAWQVVTIPANILLRPGDTYLIGLGGNGNGVNVLPAPNLTGSIAVNATDGKIALVNNGTPLTGSCPNFALSGVVDFVGYGGTANCNGTGTDTADAPSPSTTRSIQRNASGSDTDLDSADFATAPPTPQPAQFPTPAAVSVSGRVYTSSGQGVSKAVITIQGGSLTEPKRAITSSFGYYTVTDLVAGETYVVTVGSKQYAFTNPTRVVQAGDNAEGVDFVAEP